MSESEFDGGEMQCSYCGNWIYADSPRCPRCGNYTDGLGQFADPVKEGKRLPRVMLVAGWLVIIALVIPILIALIFTLFRH